MEIIENIKVPTGNIMIVKGDKGNLECLSIGDYGQNTNIKADFLGLSRPIEKVTHQEMLSLTDKWVITISTQYGCSMNCRFCDVPKVGKGINTTYNDLKNQIIVGLEQHPEVTYTNRLNVHYARMGEPTWNINVLDFTENMKNELRPFIGDSLIHPVISTMLPKNNIMLNDYIDRWCNIKNNLFNGDAGLQFSINSTSNNERNYMFSDNTLSLEEISIMANKLPMPKGRKYTLNFAIAEYEVDGRKLANLFDTNKFICKITPMHKTNSAIDNNIQTHGDYTTIYPYEHIEEDLKNNGFDVLVFIASEYEDLGRITCGNAILSGSLPDCPYEVVKS